MMLLRQWTTRNAPATGAAYLLHGVAQREARRRRTLVWGTAGLTVLSIAPVFAHHLEPQSASALASTSHLGEICVVALHQILTPVHTLFHVVLLLGVVYATCDRVRHALRARRTLSVLDASPPARDDVWWRAATAAGVDPSDVRVVDGLPNPAFTIGWLRPRIYLSSTLALRLSPDELTAVLAHEGAHVANRDPLRLSAYRFLGCMFFWIPAFRRMADDVVDETEVQADDAAARATTGVHPLVLASALLSVASWAAADELHGPASSASSEVGARLVPGAVGFSSRDILARRVRRLAGEAAPVVSHVTRRSVMAAAAALALVWASGIVVAHPLAAQRVAGAAATAHRASSAMRMDCSRHHRLALFHILCPEDPQSCPHAS